MVSAAGNYVSEEMKRVLKEVNQEKLGKNPLTVKTLYGRTYEVCLVAENLDNWVPTTPARGYFECDRCTGKTFPGGNWWQITLKNGTTDSEPVIRLYEPYHWLEFHPQRIDDIASSCTKCQAVFGNIIQQVPIPVPNSVIDIHASLTEKQWGLQMAKDEAILFAAKNTFNVGTHQFHYSGPEFQIKLYDLIRDVLEDKNFIENPNEFISKMKSKREVGPKVLIPFDQLIEFFDKYLPNMQEIAYRI